jgi:hypothetical protein
VVVTDREVTLLSAALDARWASRRDPLSSQGTIQFCNQIWVGLNHQLPAGSFHYANSMPATSNLTYTNCHFHLQTKHSSISETKNVNDVFSSLKSSNNFYYLTPIRSIKTGYESCRKQNIITKYGGGGSVSTPSCLTAMLTGREN